MPSLVNWNNEIKFDVLDDKFKKPSGISEVQTIVKDANARNAKVKVIGAMHSVTPCFVVSDIVLSNERMNNILSIDKTNLTVTVQAGVSLHQLCGYLKPLGYQPPVVLEWGNFHFGAVSGTHTNDSSLTDGAQVSSFVVGVKLVKSNGELLEISEKQNTQYLAAIRSHFGLFGVVCEATLRIWPARPLLFTYTTRPLTCFLSTFPSQMNQLRSTSDQAFALLFQSTNTILLQHRKFVDPQTYPPHPLTNSLESKAINLFTSLILPATQALSRSRNSNMVVVDPEHHEPRDPRWVEFRRAFGELAMQHGGIPHINKTVEAAQLWYAKACDQEALREYLDLRKQFDPKDMFLNEFFGEMFKGHLQGEGPVKAMM
jgi:L-gulonolactone oxidase